jgi:5'-3' exonuclease
MGIPSYFRHILKRYPGLLGGIKSDFKSDVLLIDFNCLIYGCVRSQALGVFCESDRSAWEQRLLAEVNSYVVKIWTAAGKPATVVLGVDGVVPMAKIRQQRLRRFKSVWLGQKEREYGVRSGESWDTNSITPGTAFMEALTVSLKGLCKARGGWTVSGAEEFGEGEQKLLEWVRARSAELEKKRIVVYGLDADLIVLSLLHASTVVPNTAWTILREAQEFGSAHKSNDEFLGLDIQGLLKILFPVASTRNVDVMNYVAGMSLLGNDFVPHSLGINIREGGHDRLLAALKNLQGAQLVQNGLVNPVALLEIVKEFAGSEAADISEAFKRKYTMRMTPRTDAERLMLPVQNLPLEWAEEDKMWSQIHYTMHSDWQIRYYGETLVQQDVHQRCMAYLQGIQWVLNYYTGKPVSKEWMYAWTHPPLWSDLALTLEGLVELPVPTYEGERPLEPQEQLAMVLPLESWGLIRSPVLKSIPALAPTFWPKTYGFESLGKRWFWECAPVIPIITPKRLYVLASSAREQIK